MPRPKSTLLTLLLLLCSTPGLRAAAPEAAASPYEGQAVSEPFSKIDACVFQRQKSLGIEPARLCSDSVFVRRVFLDAIGSLPTAEEAKSFIADPTPDKRSRLIDALLEREEYADTWAMKWSDLLRIKSEFPINLWPNGVQSYHRWVRSSIKENKPYDQFVREMLKSSGSNFRMPPANVYRAMQGNDPATIAKTVALTFMGTRAASLTPKQLEGLSAFFWQLGFKSTGEWKETIVFWDASKAADPKMPTASFPDGKPALIPPGTDPRFVFADWLTAPDNPWFAKAIVNRAWSWVLGRGIIHEPDDLRPDNPPSNPELLAWLEQDFVASHYDLKRLFRTILNSQVYQLSSVSRSQHPEAAAQFASYPLRRLDAEVLIDAICQITGTHERYSSAIPEPFTYVPEEQRSIGLSDASISSPFLELFGRSSRDTGLEAERNNRITDAQRLHLLNSSHIRNKILQSPLLRAPQQPRSSPQEAINEIYLAVLSRYPTPAELQAIAGYLRGGPPPQAQAQAQVKAQTQTPAPSTDKAAAPEKSPPPPKGKAKAQAQAQAKAARQQAKAAPAFPNPARDGLVDLVWALINTNEFLHRH
jgi:hypothetical protein